MEHVCREIKEKVCVDYENEEIQEIMQAVDILMNRFVNELKNKFPQIKIERLELCGSMAEKTRIWGTDPMCDMEFDYLAIIKSWPGCGNFKFSHTTSPCEMEVKYEVIHPQPVTGEYVHLTRDVTSVFLANFYKCMHEKCKENFCALAVHDVANTKLVSGCQFCSIYMQTGTLKCTDTMLWPQLQSMNNFHGRLHFLWQSKKSSINIPYTSKDMDTLLSDAYEIIHYENDSKDCLPLTMKWRNETVNEITIEVDFNPVLRVDVPRVQDKHVSNLDKCKNYYLFPKSREIGINQWRISTWEIELDILTGSSADHILAYSVLKFLLNPKRLYILSTSRNQYQLKLATIKHILKCKTPSIGAHVCLLYILHDIALYNGENKMIHPLLLYDLYDLEEYKCDRLKVVYLNVFILILAYQKGAYSVSELFHDLVSIGCIEETYNSSSYMTLHPLNWRKLVLTREQKLDLRHLINVRKMHRPRDVLLAVSKTKQWNESLWNLQILIQNFNLKNVKIE